MISSSERQSLKDAGMRLGSVAGDRLLETMRRMAKPEPEPVVAEIVEEQPKEEE